MGSIFLSGLRDQNFGENGAQGSKKRQENRDQWVPDIPCYDRGICLALQGNFFKTSCHFFFYLKSFCKRDY